MPMTDLGPSPLTAGDPNLSVADARAAIHAAIAAASLPCADTESVALADATGRVLAEALVSTMDVPPHDNSAMDGYAFDGAALRDDAALELDSVATVYAGAPFAGTLAAGQCVRIMTGAVMPAGLDTVVPQELCRADGTRITIAPATLRPGENRRKRGEDLALGQAALPAGRVLRPADLGLAASLGYPAVTVRRRLKVALFSTGDEVFAPGTPLPPGGIYDSNRASLRAALQRLGMQVVDLGLVPDDPAALQAVLHRAVRQADAVMTSGGVSVGDADYTRDLLARMGEVAFWKVAMRPGRPFAFGPLRAVDADGSAHAAWLFALPGNPVAALVTFFAFARDALLQLAGARAEPLPTLRVPSASAIRKRPGRTEFQRGIVEPGADGLPQVRLTGAQGAGILRSLSEANALVVLGHAQGSVAAGEPVEVWLFDGLV
jgi:molybdopterin molybdotransferase